MFSFDHLLGYPDVHVDRLDCLFLMSTEDRLETSILGMVFG